MASNAIVFSWTRLSAYLESRLGGFIPMTLHAGQVCVADELRRMSNSLQLHEL